jgi:hypothetical protein
MNKPVDHGGLDNEGCNCAFTDRQVRAFCSPALSPASMKAFTQRRR